MTVALLILAAYLLAVAAIFYGVRAGWFDPAGPYVVEATGTMVRLSDGRSFVTPAGKVFCTGETITSRPAQAPFIWALVDTDAPEEARVFHVRGTGHPADALGRYVGTFQIDGGALVFHLFEGEP